MIISLCGNTEDKNIVIKELKDIYKEKMLVLDYYKLLFQTLVKTEKYKYELMDKYKDFNKVHKLYKKHTEEIAFNEANNILNNNKEKIIILVSDNILYKDIDNTSFFDNSLKVLITPKYNNHFHKYDESLFDLIIESKDAKKLVKLC